MKHYCETISADLAKKLKEKGMPMITSVSISIVEDKPVVDENGEQWYRPMFAEVFDWMLGKHEAYVDVFPLRTDNGWQYYGRVQGWGIDTTLGWRDTWHEAANAAIEKALTLI